eukprot:766940-Hanusia_phi.AAC.7
MSRHVLLPHTMFPLLGLHWACRVSPGRARPHNRPVFLGSFPGGGGGPNDWIGPQDSHWPGQI